MSGPLATVRAALAGVVVIGLLAATGACSRPSEPDKAAPRSVFVVEKIIPFGMLVGVATARGSITQTTVPGDVVPAGALESLDGLRCEVAVRDLPNGTILTRSSFGEPSSVGLTEGLTNDTSRDTGCRS